MANLADVKIIHEGPIKTQPGGGTDIDYVKASECPMPVTIVLDDISVDSLGRKWARVNGHWEGTGLQGWVELAHTDYSQRPPAPPEPPAPVPEEDQSVFIINWISRTITIKPK